MKLAHRIRLTRLRLLIIATCFAVLTATLLLVNQTAAQEGSPLHPTFPILDADGSNVLDSGQPASTMKTCGACHDTMFIAEHNMHGSALTGVFETPSAETVVVDPDSGRLVPLEGSAEIEINCFLCHTTNPDNNARLAALIDGQHEWANSATLLETGILTASADGYVWNPDAFAEDGTLLPDMIGIRDPSVQNCAQCHGLASTDAVNPLVFDECDASQSMTLTTGQVFAPQRISLSGMNLEDKEGLTRSWDVHAERIVNCVDCHYSLNNPAYNTRSADERPEHLQYDPRGLTPGEYLAQPLHDLARSDVDEVTDGGCTSCHAAENVHEWLPYTQRHIDALACESCHIPELEAPALQSVDWTVLNTDHRPATVCRGVEGGSISGDALITGFTPTLLMSDNGQIAPHNVIGRWYWVSGEETQPVTMVALQAAYFEDNGYAGEVLDVFDANSDGDLSDEELIIDNEAKEAVIVGRLEVLGFDDPRIVADVETYPINHSVTHGEFATSDCRTCHGDDSQLAAGVPLSNNPPGSVTPALDDTLGGEIITTDNGSLYFQPTTGQQGTGRYIFGFSRVQFIDLIGALSLVIVLLGVTVHGGLRYFAARRHIIHEPAVEEVYMYGVYERLWHWLQTAAILLLIVTGLIIHKPELFGMFSFRWVVLTHNVLAVILVVNAALAAFYHFVSGEIRQFLPEPRGFFSQAITQATFYLKGIFSGEEHPFDKTPERKLNPLQQITYLGLLNVLLPLQIITGAMMWGVERWPELTARLGGLPFLAPFHTLIAWLFASFVVMHVYLTTTGPTPLASIKGMIMGWDEVEAPATSK